jgi:hypothetical protein
MYFEFEDYMTKGTTANDSRQSVVTTSLQGLKMVGNLHKSFKVPITKKT